MTDVSKKLLEITQSIREFERRYNREPNSVKLLGAIKGQSLEKVQTAITSGLTVFGENYLQEALEAMEALKNNNLEWHFIGQIQSNKTKKIAEHFSWVQSVDSTQIAQRLNNQRPAHLPPLNICLEINISGERSKSGILPNNALDLATFCSSLPNLKLRGLMAIPATENSFEIQRKNCRELKHLFDKLCTEGFSLDTLSIGMSNDLEAAIAEGSTMVRIGTAIFGMRI